MTVRRLFVIWTDPLFHESVRLLLKHPDIIWLGAAADFTTAHEEIMRLHPNTILFEKTRTGLPADVMGMLESEIGDMRIIELSLDTNEMILYHRQHQTVVEAGDLLKFVLS
jgi:hypothetical protein